MFGTKLEQWNLWFVGFPRYLMLILIFDSSFNSTFHILVYLINDNLINFQVSSRKLILQRKNEWNGSWTVALSVEYDINQFQKRLWWNNWLIGFNAHK